MPQDVSAAPSIPASALQQLHWMPVSPSQTLSSDVSAAGQTLNVAGISGPVMAYSVPANIGELNITLTSKVSNESVYAPNVLVLDQNFTPAAFFPSHFFTYRGAGSDV